jgi:hypothetical protein
MIEIFLRRGINTTTWTEQDRFVNLSEVPPPVFASRLSLMLNHFYMLTLVRHGKFFTGSNPTDLSTFGYDFGGLPANGSVSQAVVDESCRFACTQSTTATLTHTVEIFSYSRPWLALLFICSTVLLATGLAGTVVGWRTHTPDILGYVTSLTYNNRYFPLPEHGGVLDAMHRARILRDIPIVVADVRGSNDVGRIAFTSETEQARALEKGRKYV